MLCGLHGLVLGRKTLFSPNTAAKKTKTLKRGLNERLLPAFSFLVTVEALFLRPCFSVLDAFCPSVFPLISLQLIVQLS